MQKQWIQTKPSPRLWYRIRYFSELRWQWYLINLNTMWMDPCSDTVRWVVLSSSSLKTIPGPQYELRFYQNYHNLDRKLDAWFRWGLWRCNEKGWWRSSLLLPRLLIDPDIRKMIFYRHGGLIYFVRFLFIFNRLSAINFTYATSLAGSTLFSRVLMLTKSSCKWKWSAHALPLSSIHFTCICFRFLGMVKHPCLFNFDNHSRLPYPVFFELLFRMHRKSYHFARFP